MKGMTKALALLVVLGAVAPAWAIPSNYFDVNTLYAIEGNGNRAQISEAAPAEVEVSGWVDGLWPTGTPATGVYKMDGNQNVWASLTFSASGTPGVNSPRGARQFNLGKDNLGYPVIQEVDYANVIQREMYLGRVAGSGASFDATGATIFGNIRYNSVRNTLLVPVSHNGGAPDGSNIGVQRSYIYEFALPDSPLYTGCNGVGETLGATLMETYDLGADYMTGYASGVVGSAGHVTIGADGKVYFKSQASDVLSFSGAGAAIPGGVTTGPTTVVTNALLNAINNGTNSLDNQWESVTYRPLDNSLVVMQRKTGSTTPYPQVVGWNLTTNSGSLLYPNPWITGSSQFRGQLNGFTDPMTGYVWMVSTQSQNQTGGIKRLGTDNATTVWLTGTTVVSMYDAASPTPEPATLTLLSLGLVFLRRRRVV
jgi:MYXO-CTERM domain-containing protein